jgi:hypothetical protein
MDGTRLLVIIMTADKRRRRSQRTMFVGCYRIGRRPNMSINDACGDAGESGEMKIWNM